MDFSKILGQRDAKAEAVEPGKPGRKSSPAAKRNTGWVAATFYLRPETRARLQQAAMLLKIAGIEGPDGIQDQSDLIEAALQQFLPEVEDTGRAAMAKKQEEWNATGQAVVGVEKKRRARS